MFRTPDSTNRPLHIERASRHAHVGLCMFGRKLPKIHSPVETIGTVRTKMPGALMPTPPRQSSTQHIVRSRLGTSARCLRSAIRGCRLPLGWCPCHRRSCSPCIQKK
eukprot:6190094-Pleurochrysis_carterae.AAC.5